MNAIQDDPKILVQLDESSTKPGFAVLSLVEWDYLDNDGEFGIVARCEDGSGKAITEKLPTFAEYYDIDCSKQTSLDKIKAQVCDVFGYEEDDLPWFEYDSADQVLAESDTHEAAVAWLDQLIDMASGEFCEFGIRSVTEFAPGFDLARCATDEEREQLLLQEAYLGGPGNAIPCIVVENKPELITAAFERHGLKYVLLE